MARVLQGRALPNGVVLQPGRTAWPTTLRKASSAFLRLWLATGPLLEPLCSAGAKHRLELNGDAVKIPLEKPRRSLQVSFTCNKCGMYFFCLCCLAELSSSEPWYHRRYHRVLCADGRTTRLVNPQAWEKGLVFLQCQQCEVWHKLRDEANLIEEVRFIDDETDSKV